jgi:hypothetical protein
MRELAEAAVDKLEKMVRSEYGETKYLLESSLVEIKDFRENIKKYDRLFSIILHD